MKKSVKKMAAFSRQGDRLLIKYEKSSESIGILLQDVLSVSVDENIEGKIPIGCFALFGLCVLCGLVANLFHVDMRFPGITIFVIGLIYMYLVLYQSKNCDNVTLEINGGNRIFFSVDQGRGKPIMDEILERKSFPNVIEVCVSHFFAGPIWNLAAVGQAIRQGDVLCEYEFGEVDGQIEAEFSGTIVKVLVEEYAQVSFGQPLFWIRPT
jgi:hypothetical protein